jgi:hypothetical protein
MNDRGIEREEARVQHELDWIKRRPRSLAMISTTAKNGIPFAVTPRKSALGYDCICMMFGEEAHARRILPLLAGQVSAILVDVEAKKSFSLEALCCELIPGMRLIPCKPNDATLESADLLLQARVGPDLYGKKIFVYALGNIGTKIAMRLAERGAEVFAFSRNTRKCRQVCDAINLVLPKYTPFPVRFVEKIEGLPSATFDAMLSCSSSSQNLGMEMVAAMKNRAVVIDVGIDNFKPEFYLTAKIRELQCFRLDIRIGFPYLLMPLFDHVDTFLNQACGCAMLDNRVCIVSGGFVGPRGAVIVDNIRTPTQAVGVANGVGGLIPEAEMEQEHREHIAVVRAYVESRSGMTVAS